MGWVRCEVHNHTFGLRFTTSFLTISSKSKSIGRDWWFRACPSLRSVSDPDQEIFIFLEIRNRNLKKSEPKNLVVTPSPLTPAGTRSPLRSGRGRFPGVGQHVLGDIRGEIPHCPGRAVLEESRSASFSPLPAGTWLGYVPDLTVLSEFHPVVVLLKSMHLSGVLC